MVKNNDIHDEIEQLKNQLDAVKQTRQKSVADIQEQDTSTIVEKPETNTMSAISSTTNNTECDDSDLSDQFQELIDILDQEIKDINPTTMLVVFALGVLVGRLLPK